MDQFFLTTKQFGACVWASVYLDQDQDQNLCVLRNTDVSEIQHMFSIIHSLENKGVFGLDTID